MNIRSIRLIQSIAIAACLLLLTTAPGAQEPAESWDGLKLVPGTKVAAAYVHPDADFRQYGKFVITEPYIAFKKDWKREHRDVSASEMERIKERLGHLFVEVFTEALEEGGFPVVTSTGEDVLVLRPALIDLDVTAPDIMTAGRSRTYVTSAGAVTLYIELLDGATGAMLARAIDRKAGRNTTSFQISSSVYNAAEARTVLKFWAGLLRDRFKEIHGR
ncbi:MAG: hypothetical protein A3H91_04360 [Gammaproteobacteria bacterium RIFCSPLOWO2_02_FULL_61_13]|nr:MAG: hypothetical protein A3H91_04360 [Gammaproteobacteria bacterium RIFCSPLOWO2_02_FULL_61_13]